VTLRILLVDDQALLRLGFRMILEAQPDFDVVGEAGDGHAGITLARALNPDVVLMDVRLPGVDGIAATASIVAANPAVKVLILTTFDLDEYVYGGLRAGASGFLLKDALPAQLITAIRNLAAGDAVIAPRATRRLLDTFAAHLPDPEQSSRRTELVTALTERELDVLLQVAGGRSNREIAERLNLSEGTVKVHVGRFLTKLELRDRVQAVVLAYEVGLVTPGACP
jgi:DNA-binding NarL/FixJ family response regulator